MLKSYVTVITSVIVAGATAAATLYLSMPYPSGSTTTTITTSGESANYSVCFSPGGGCASKVIGIFSKANSSIYVLIYTFTNQDIANALVQAKSRGVDVKVLMDEGEAQFSTQTVVVSILQQSHAPLKTFSPSGGILHDKVAVVDGKIVVTSSYNWTISAESYNDENLLILTSSPLAASYSKTFNQLWGQA